MGAAAVLLPSDTLQMASSAKPGQNNNTARSGRPPPSPVKSCRADSRMRPGRSPPPAAKSGRNNDNNNSSSKVRAGTRNLTGEVSESRHRMVVKFPARNLVMGEVKILKRGEEMKPDPTVVDRKPQEPLGSDGGDDLIFCSTDRLGPEPEILPRQIRLMDQKSVYAGSASATSPSPSSLPFPASFFAKKDVASKTDLATKGLRYLLRLDVS